jgi:hypothetical protein
MDFQAEREIRNELKGHESLLWAGKPRQGLRLTAGDALMIPFSLMWCGFAVVWEVTAIRAGGPFFFVLWGLPFVAVGLYLVFGRFFADAYRRGRTFYGLTGERVLIVTLVRARKVESLGLTGLSQVELTEKAQRRGSIRFGAQAPMQAWFASSGWPGASRGAPPSFEDIDDARDVYDRLQRAQEELRRARV